MIGWRTVFAVLVLGESFFFGGNGARSSVRLFTKTLSERTERGEEGLKLMRLHHHIHHPIQPPTPHNPHLSQSSAETLPLPSTDFPAGEGPNSGPGFALSYSSALMSL